MLNNIMIGRYFPAKSKLHEMHPFFKLLSLIIYIVLVFRVTGIFGMTISSIFLILIAILSEVDYKIYLKSIYSLRYLIVSILLVSYLSEVNMVDSLVSVTRIIVIVTYSTILTLTTKPLDLMYGLEVLFKPLYKFPVKKYSFILVNSIKLIPIIIDNTNDYLKSQYVFLYKNVSIKEKLIITKEVIVPILVNLVNSFELIVTSLELKLFDFDIKYNYQKKIKNFDYYFLAMHVLLFILLGGFL